METRHDFILAKLTKGKIIWRYAKSCAISYELQNNIVLRTSHTDSGLCTTKKISLYAAINQLKRNFKQIGNIY